jgi:SAM-dependent methyltransferase
MKDWIAFWDSPNSIYVNARHREAHYLKIAEDITRYVPAEGYVLDYGCGEALHADMPAAIAHRLFLCEAAPGVRANLVKRFTGNPKILVIGPEQVAELEDRSLDLIVMHSVAQYLTEEEFGDLLMLFRALLKPDGLLVVGDIIPRGVSAMTDALQLLRFAREEGFFLGALFGLLRTMFSRYWRLRSRLGLARYDRDEMLRKLTRAGFWVTTAERNIGHNQARVTYLGRLSPRHE